MKKIAVLSAALFAFGLSANAQDTQAGRCGMSAEELKALSVRTLENLAAPTSVRERGAIQYVPIHFHIVGSASGTGKARESNILDQICNLNADYLPLDIQFYLSPHPTQGIFDYSINNDNVYDQQTNSFLMSNRKHAKALNVFVVNNAESGNSLPGQTLAYYSTVWDWVVSRKDQINGSGNGTLSHEIGHFFSLLHTFHGWDQQPFDNTFASWPCAPAISPGGVPTEKQDGSNCTTAGDYICDTPPDYNSGFGWPNCSNYTGGAKDPMCELIDPDEQNYMGYFIGCPNYHFSAGQGTQIHKDLDAQKRNYLDNTFAPAASSLTVPADLLQSPLASTTTQFYDLVDLSWKAVPEATYYLVELDLTSGFSTGYFKSFVTKDTKLTVTTLTKGKTYYWRVRPFNEYLTCKGTGAGWNPGTFKTPLASGTTDIQEVTEWSVAPNPTGGAASATVSVDANESFEASVSVTDAAGKVLFQQPSQRFAAGQNTVELPVGRFANGLYFVSLGNGEARMTKKLVVLN